jgi:hypothetical protein
LTLSIKVAGSDKFAVPGTGAGLLTGGRQRQVVRAVRQFVRHGGQRIPECGRLIRVSQAAPDRRSGAQRPIIDLRAHRGHFLLEPLQGGEELRVLPGDLGRWGDLS